MVLRSFPMSSKAVLLSERVTGRGVLFLRDANGAWHAPVFIALTGGNVGWQVGVQSSDIILVFKTAKSVQGIVSGKLTLGADAAAAAGPVGRQAAAATDGRLQAEIYSYSRSRGIVCWSFHRRIRCPDGPVRNKCLLP